MIKKISIVDEALINTPPLEVMKIASTGPDKKWFQKRGSSLLPKLANLEPEKGKEAIYIIPMGAMEYYSSNRNADGWPAGKCVKYARNGQPMKIKAGLKENHPTFVSSAHIFTEHNNDDPEIASGEIVLSDYNEKMGRVEVVAFVDEEDWAEELDEIENEKGACVSMAALVENDQCLPPYIKIETDEGCKEIQHIKVGDLVRTHKGRFREVTKLFERETTESLRKIKVHGLLDPLELTGNHHIYAIRDEDMRVTPTWIPANELDKGDHVAHPMYTSEDEGNILLPIESVEEIKDYNGKVYNIAVEEDESYIAGGVVVHNCNVCSNVAEGADDYCQHIQFYKNAVLEDGNQVMMVNNNPEFIDISRVKDPADRLGMAISRVMSGSPQKAASKPSTINKGARLSILKKLAALEQEFDPAKCYGEEGRLLSAEGDPKPLDETHTIIIKSTGTEKGLGALAEEGILLPPEEFFNLAIDEDDYKDNNTDEPCDLMDLNFNDIIDEVKKVLPQSFSSLLDDVLTGEDIFDNMLELEGSGESEEGNMGIVTDELKPWLGLDESDVDSRITITIIGGGSDNDRRRKKQIKECKRRKKSVTNCKEAYELAKIYAGYLVNGIELAEKNDRKINKKAVIVRNLIG